MPQAATRIRTSSGPGVGIGKSASSSWRYLDKSRAFMFATAFAYKPAENISLYHEERDAQYHALLDTAALASRECARFDFVQRTQESFGRQVPAWLLMAG